MLVRLHSTHDDLNLRAAFCLAFSAFIRIGEFTWSQWDSQSFLLHLSRGSVHFVPDGVLLQLPTSKTDPFRKGVSIPWSQSSEATCSVSALQLLFHRYPKPIPYSVVHMAHSIENGFSVRYLKYCYLPASTPRDTLVILFVVAPRFPLSWLGLLRRTSCKWDDGKAIQSTGPTDLGPTTHKISGVA
jgi:hypothetical protein